MTMPFHTISMLAIWPTGNICAETYGKGLIGPVTARLCKLAI